MNDIGAIARAVLYEGYILWPYRRSAPKNRQRWTFGGVFPRAHSTSGHPDDPWELGVECLIEGASATTVDVRLRFLHVVQRRIARVGSHGLEFLDELTVAGERQLSWEEATEREVSATGLSLGQLALQPLRLPIDLSAGGSEEPLPGPDGRTAAMITRSWCALSGSLEIAASALEPGLYKLVATVRNTTSWAGGARSEAQQRSLISTHIGLQCAGGGFVSLTDPPAELVRAARSCRRAGLWPVLVGAEGERHSLLAAPIILPDYPQVAPESPGDLFDGTEIDQLLVLNILAMTEDEQQEMRASDPRAREILERTASLTRDQLMQLHGAVREFRPLPTRAHGDRP